MEDKLVEKLITKRSKRDNDQKLDSGMEKKDSCMQLKHLEMGVTEALIANGQKENPISSAIEHNNCTVITEHE